MADGDVPVQRVEHGLVEDLGDQTHVLVDHDPGAIADRDTSRLLATMLERVQPVIGELGHILARRPDSEDPAGIPGRSVSNVS